MFWFFFSDWNVSKFSDSWFCLFFPLFCSTHKKIHKHSKFKKKQPVGNLISYQTKKHNRWLTVSSPANGVRVRWLAGTAAGSAKSTAKSSWNSPRQLPSCRTRNVPARNRRRRSPVSWGRAVSQTSIYTLHTKEIPSPAEFDFSFRRWRNQVRALGRPIQRPIQLQADAGNS